MTDRNALHDPNEPPEDVASLYSWANLHGAKYRDFSASRAQNREKARMQMQQAIDEQQRAQRDIELQQAEAARDAAQAALAAERARQAEIDAHYAAQQAALQAAQQAAYEAAQLAARQAAQQAAHEAAQQAAQEVARQAAEQAAREARAAQFAAQQAAQQAAQELARQAAEHSAQQAAQEMARQAAEQAAREARAAQEAAQQAARQAAEEMARQAAEHAAREARAAHEAAQRAAEHAAEQAARQAAEQAAQEAARERVRQAAERAAEEARMAEEQAAQQAAEHAAQQAAQQAAEHAAQEMARQAAERAAEEARVAQLEAAQHADAARAAQQAAQQAAWQQPVPERLSPASSLPQAEQFGFPAAFPLPGSPAQRTTQRITAREEAVPPPARTPWSVPEPREIPARPAWLAERPSLSGIPTVTQSPEDTLQGSRERLTSRWFALKGVFDTGGVAVADAAIPAAATSRAPVLAIFSLAGGVGKTSLVATLGRALSSRGERVLLVDTAAFGLLPFFFGARDQRPGQLRTFSPPAASGDAPIQMIAVDPESLGPENGGQEPLTAEIQQHIRSVGRVIVDLATASGSTTRRLLRLSPSVLVPVIPDMNSVVSVGSIDAFFERNSSIAGKASLPHYVLNQFDASLPLHLDVREVLREQLGDRLLPFALRRAPAISEALAEGMTVMDYAPNSTVAEDFGTLAGWVKSQSAPASSGFRGVRWSER